MITDGPWSKERCPWKFDREARLTLRVNYEVSALDSQLVVSSGCKLESTLIISAAIYAAVGIKSTSTVGVLTY